jgi:hypothetical protein
MPAARNRSVVLVEPPRELGEVNAATVMLSPSSVATPSRPSNTFLANKIVCPVQDVPLDPSSGLERKSHEEFLVVVGNL